MDFQTFHRYNKLVRRGITKPIACQHCGNEMALVAKKIEHDLEPAFRCFYCNTLILPGLKMFGQIQSVVKEHYV